MKIDVIVPLTPREWHRRFVERLRHAGHDVVATAEARAPVLSRPTEAILALERRLLRRSGGLLNPATLALGGPRGDATLDIDLAGSGSGRMALLYDGNPDPAALLAALAAGRLVDLDVALDGKRFDHAAPMIDHRIFMAAAAEDVLARAITVLLRAVARFVAGERAATPLAPRDSPNSVATAWLSRSLPRIGREAWRRARYRHAHWRVGYRVIDGPGVAEAAALGTGWRVLPDDGTHFYADPLPFERDGTRHIFVEDYPHATGKAVISVSTLGADGVAVRPVPVIEEPHHLSYPQVFAHDGAIWMLPEASSSGRLVLYRADRFPDRWSPAATLIEQPISDATLLIRGDGFWLFATDRDGDIGSTSDTLVVFYAQTLTGPWTPHRANPILIDRRRARPGGAVIQHEGTTLLPIQDGTLGYGGGLGLSALMHLDHDLVEFADPRPIATAGTDFAYPQIHTLNRAGRLEVIDGIAAVRKR